MTPLDLEPLAHSLEPFSGRNVPISVWDLMGALGFILPGLACGFLAFQRARYLRKTRSSDMREAKSFLKFVDLGGPPTRKTPRWEVRGTHDALGKIGWFARWRGFVFCPSEDRIFDAAYLREIADFLDTANAEAKAQGIAEVES